MRLSEPVGKETPPSLEYSRGKTKFYSGDPAEGLEQLALLLRIAFVFSKRNR